MFKKLCLIIGFVMYSAITAYAGLEDESGWFSRGVGTFTIENGELSVDSPPEMETFAWKNISDDLGFDNFTLRLKAKVLIPYDVYKNIVIYFCDERYKFVFRDGTEDGTKTVLYKRLWYDKPWEILVESPFIQNIVPDTWYTIEIGKYRHKIYIKINGIVKMATYDDTYWGGSRIALGAYNSHVHYDHIEILPSVTGTVTSTKCNSPIAGAKIEIFKSDTGELIKETFTKSDGSYAVFGIYDNMNFDIKVSKERYIEKVLTNQKIDIWNRPSIIFSPMLESVVSLNNILCYPNPARDTDKINFVYNLEIPAKVIIKIYNVVGELIDKIEEYKGADAQVTTWNISKIASGIYIYTLEADRFKKVGKLGIIKSR